MRKEALSILALSFILLFFLSPLFKTGFYESHDGENHVARFGAYYKAFSDGQIIPRFAGELNFGYGTPVLNFFYPLPGYIGSLFHVIGFSLQDSFKIIAGVSFILAPILFYLWSREMYAKIVAFTAALFYGLAPYHFLDLYVRGDIGEVMSFIFIPAVFWMLEKNMKKVSYQSIAFGGISYALLILSHHGIALLFSPIFAAYIFLRMGISKKALVDLAMLFIGLMLSSFFWLPAMYEGRFIQTELLLSNVFKENFPSFSSLIYSPWGFGADVGLEGALSPQIGPLSICIVILAITMLRSAREKTRAYFFLAVFFVAVFIALPSSMFIWEKVPLLAQLQFPWRLTALSSFAAAVLAGFALTKIDQRPIVLLIIVLFVTSFSFVSVRDYVDKPDSYYLSFPGTTYYHGEATTIWTAGDASASPKSPIEIISGEAMVNELVKKSNRHTFIITAETDGRLLDNTIYFPGWRVFIDGKKVPIEFQDINYRGLITFRVPTGEHSVDVTFGESPIRFVSDLVSLGTLLLLISLFILRRRLRSLTL